jgi:CRISPR-associated protein Csh1
MLKEVAELGKICGEDFLTHIFTPSMINKAKRGKVKLKLIAIEFDENGNYIKPSLEDYDENDYRKYYYRRGASNGPNCSPACIITKIEKSFNGKIKRWFNTYGSEDPLLSKINAEINKKGDEIISDIVRLKEEYSGSKDIFSLVIKINGKHIGELDKFRNVIYKIYETGMKEHKSKRKAKGAQGICMICNKSDIDVYPVSVSSAFEFATIDKKGFLTNFSEENAWKNISVCLDCGKNISIGKNFLDKYLNFQLYGQINFYVIPKFVIGVIDSYILREIKKIRSGENKDEGAIRSLVSEDDLYAPFLRENDVMSLIYLFYEKQQKKMRILGISEEVYPSRLKKLFESMESSVDYFIFKEDFLKKIFGKKSEGHIGFKSLASEFNKFFPLNSNKYGSYEQNFVDVINSILSDRKIDKNILVSQFMKFIRNDFKNQGNGNSRIWKYRTLDAIKIFKFLNSLRLISNIGYGDKMANMLDSEEKKVSFLVGVYVAKLLNEQYKLRDSTPFVRKLYGLNLNEERIKELFKEAYNKLLEYDKEHFYEWLSQKISEYFVKIKDGWRLTDDEISFCFTCGLALGKALKEDEINKILKDEL